MPFENSNKEQQSFNRAPEGNSEQETSLSSRSTLAALAAVTAFAMGMENAEARTTPISIEQAPHVFQMKQDLAKKGIEIKNLSTCLGGVCIETTHGAVTILLPTHAEANVVRDVLNGVSVESFVNELERQNTRARRINEMISTGHGNVEITLTPYAQEVLRQNNYSYKDGIIRSTINASTINLLGTKKDPNTACMVSGGGQFNDSIEALCKELKVSATGTPYASDVRYTITFTASGFGVKQEVQ